MFIRLIYGERVYGTGNSPKRYKVEISEYGKSSIFIHIKFDSTVKGIGSDNLVSTASVKSVQLHLSTKHAHAIANAIIDLQNNANKSMTLDFGDTDSSKDDINE